MDSTQLANLIGPRSVEWTYTLRSLDGALIGNLDGVVSGEFSASSDAVIRTGGKLAWRRPPNGETPDWSRVLVQPIYRASFPDGSSLSWPIGVFIPAVPTTTQKGASIAADVELYDQLLILDEDRFAETYSIAEGAIVTEVIRALLAEAGIANLVVTDSALTLRGPAVWDGGTSRLRVINDLLSAIGYFSLWVDGFGVFRAEPYVAPSSRLAAWEFADNASSIYTDDLDEELDTFGVPNRVVLVARTGDGETLPLTAVAENTDPADPLSKPSRGRWITQRIDNVEAATQSVLDGMAARYLDDAGRSGSTVRLEHFPLPLSLLDLNSRVDYSNSVTGTVALTGVVRSWSIRTEGAGLMKSTIREVA